MTEIHYLHDHLQAVALSGVKRKCARLLAHNHHALAELVRLEGQFSDQLLKAFLTMCAIAQTGGPFRGTL